MLRRTRPVQTRKLRHGDNPEHRVGKNIEIDKHRGAPDRCPTRLDLLPSLGLRGFCAARSFVSYSDDAPAGSVSRQASFR
jgi:hypothetical protein